MMIQLEVMCVERRIVHMRIRWCMEITIGQRLPLCGLCFVTSVSSSSSSYSFFSPFDSATTDCAVYYVGNFKESFRI